MNHPHRFRTRVNRRDFLRVGALAGTSLGLGDLLRMESAAAPDDRGKSAIFVFLTGGQSHLDTWDMKPEASEVAGEFKPRSTKVPGLQICELMPRLAEVADKYTVLRSVTHSQGAHTPGQRQMQTGNRLIPSLDYPDYGAVVSKELASPPGIPRYVNMPGGNGSANYSAGYLGVAYGPFTALGDPSAPDYDVRGLATPEGFTLDRLRARQQLLSRVDRTFSGADLVSPDLEGMDKAYQQAFDILQSPVVRKAFDIHSESDKTRDRYGRTRFGQSCLLARRLIEAGTRCVSLYWGDWDTHESNFSLLRSTLLPPWDVGLAALLEDLDERGMLDTTIVWCTGEFGRTPTINDRNGGRDHWPRATSMLMAGAGIRGGQVLGKTDKTASEPVDFPVSPQDCAASFYHALGIDPMTEYHTPDGRPIYLVRDGQPIRQLWGTT